MKNVETILEEALQNLAVINNPKEAKKLGMKISKIDLGEMHWLSQCAVIKIFADSTRASERKIAVCFQISKSEIHRMLMISRVPSSVRKKSFENGVEKYVLVKMTQPDLSDACYAHLIEGVLSGRITKYSQVKGLK